MEKYEEKSERIEKVHASFKRSKVCLYLEKWIEFSQSGQRFLFHLTKLLFDRKNVPVHQVIGKTWRVKVDSDKNFLYSSVVLSKIAGNSHQESQEKLLGKHSFILLSYTVLFRNR